MTRKGHVPFWRPAGLVTISLSLIILAKGLKQYPGALENFNAWGENNLCNVCENKHK